jgi:membrane peptidoglycan carboxypeptidase
MNSYGDPQSARARASVPGAGPAPTPDAYRRGSGRAGVSGSASVGGNSGRVPAGGRASVGSASVGGPGGGAAPVGSARVGGRASVGSASVGAASVARAAVRPGPAYDEIEGPGGPPRNFGGGGGGGGGKGKDPGKAAKKRRRANILTASAAVLVILLGGGVVAGTWFFDDVQLTEPKAEDQVTQLVAADNKSLLATVGDTNRSLVPYQSINPIIGEAVMAAEDKGFKEHHGIDMTGIMRAAWKNFTDGDRQGASTITQQYARHAAELKEISYNRKLREAVIARKMEDHYSKDEILGRYLNSVYFGRGAYGIEAAVKAYFGNGRSSLIQPGAKGAITPAEAAVIASVIKQPEPSATHKGYDPQNNLADAKLRWQYTLKNMVEKGWITQAEMPTEYPKVVKFDPNKCRTACGSDKATGKIVKYVKAELRAMGISDEEQSKGGLRITTTIDKDVQEAAEAVANRTSEDSPLRKFDKTYKTAMVAVNPENGRVLAYYGGPDGVGWDYAGPNYNDSGDFVGGGRPPGSSFKFYTLLAALSEGYSFKTTWDSEAKKVDGSKISNAGRESFKCDPRRCPLDSATEQSLNFPFYHLAAEMGSDKVAEAARKAGVQYITGQKGRIDLTKVTDGAKLKSQLGNEIGYGQYPITPLDHANGIATLASGGTYNKAHFVKSVQKRDNTTGKFKAYKNEKLSPKPVVEENVVGAIDHVLGNVVRKNNKSLRNGYDSIGKSGTWEYKDGSSGGNGDAWWVGATPHIAASVWIGREKEVKKKMELLPIYSTPNGKKGMSGSSVPADMWKLFMDKANKALDAKKDDFPPNAEVGDPDKGNGLPPEKPKDPACEVLGALCNEDGQLLPGGQNPGGQNPGGNNPNFPGFPGNNPQNPGGPNNGGGDNNGGGENGGGDQEQPPDGPDQGGGQNNNNDDN